MSIDINRQDVPFHFSTFPREKPFLLAPPNDNGYDGKCSHRLANASIGTDFENGMASPPPSRQDLLMPAGKPVGTKESKASIRELPGGLKAAGKFFDELIIGGIPVVVAGYPGKTVDLPDGGRIGFRPNTKSGVPTIDVNVPGIPVKKIKFV